MMKRPAVLLTILFLTGGGCRSGKEPQLAPVEGTISYKGKPLSGGQIIFHSQVGRPYAADIGPTGTFKLNVAVGRCQVTVEHREPGAEDPKGRPGMLLPGKS